MPQSVYPLTPLSPGETRVLTADFGSFFPGITVALPASPTLAVTCEVDPNSQITDPSPQDRVIGSASLRPSPDTGKANQAILQLVGNLVPGCVYRVTFTGSGSDASTPVIWQRIGAG